MKTQGTLTAAISFLLSLSAFADGWVAYNDCIDTTPATTPANATNYGLGRSYAGAGSSGTLINFDTGADTGVLATFSENFSTGNTINWATDFADYPPGTDAEAIFGGKLNLTGNMSYNDAPGWSCDLTFSNLDPDVSYTFAATVHRNGGTDYANRITNWTLTGSESAVYASSAGAHKISETTVEFSTGNNVNGLVARWTGIRSGSDGTFAIRTSHGVGDAAGGIADPDPFKGYAGGLFMLMAEPEPAPFAISTVAYDGSSDTATITWPAIEGSTYEVDGSDDLLSWSKLDGVIAIENDTATFNEAGVAAPDGRRFYRVRSL